MRWAGVRKEYGRQVALRGVTLALEAGRVAALLGPNGAGKTTLLRIGAGLTRPTEGRVELQGAEPGTRTRARCGYVGHATLLSGSLTPLENLHFYARLYGVPDGHARARAMLEEIGVGRRAAEPVSRLSRGTQQRVSLCRAFLHDASVLLLDEPFTGLDPQGTAVLVRWARARAAAGAALLIATHDLAVAREVADDYVLLAGGRLAGTGRAAQISSEAIRALYDDAARAAS
jgi:heme ABC exporter ATP-binding subunit CcmA